MKKLLPSGKSGPKTRQMIVKDLSHLQDENDKLAHALVSVLPTQEAAAQTTLEQLQAQFAETIDGIGSSE